MSLVVTLLSLVTKLHVIAGAVGLVAFWIPVFARKGGPTHLRFGRIFIACLHVVALSALLSAIAHTIAPLTFSPARVGADADATARHAVAIRSIFAFLGYLAIVTLALGCQAVAVMRVKADVARLRTPLHRGLALASIAGSILVVVVALALPTSLRWVLLSLSPIGVLVGVGHFRYASAAPVRMGWWYEHIAAIIGAGIAFHTAFLVFGVSRLTGLQPGGAWGFVPWILPTLIGVPATQLTIRHYRRKFHPAPA